MVVLVRVEGMVAGVVPLKEGEENEGMDLEVVVGNSEVLISEPGAVEVVGFVDDVNVELVNTVPHPPVTDGTASGPLPIAMSSVPQLAACARCRLRLSWSYTTYAALRKLSPRTGSSAPKLSLSVTHITDGCGKGKAHHLPEERPRHKYPSQVVPDPR